MKIAVDLLQSTGTKGGIEAYVRALYTEFGRMGSVHEFVGLVPIEAEDPAGWEWFPGEIISTGYSGENRASWAMGEMFGVSRIAERLNADLIHAPAMLGPVRSKIPVVITMHDLSYFTHPHLMRNRLLTPGVKLMEKLAARNAEALIAISETTASLIPRYLNVPAEKIKTVLSAGAEVQPCRPDTVRSNARPTFIAMGQRSPYKSLETAVRSIALISQEQRPKLIVTGSHGEDPLAPLVAELNLSADVELLGWIDDAELRQTMCASIGLIETTVAAGFGMPAVEALSMGIPVFASDIPVFREILSDAAWYFAPGSERELANLLCRALQSPEQVQQLRVIGPKQAARYSWEKTAQETLSVFEAVGSNIVER